MRKSRFSKAQIMGILRHVEGVLALTEFAASTAFRARRFTSGARSTAAWTPR